MQCFLTTTRGYVSGTTFGGVFWRTYSGLLDLSSRTESVDVTRDYAQNPTLQHTRPNSLFLR